MNQLMIKKILKGFGIFLAVSVILLAASPFLFHDKIKALVLQSINEKIDATVAFEKVNLSFFRSFPKANITIHELRVINKAPFEGDTLLYAGELHLKMAIKELFKSKGEPMQLESFTAKNSLVQILFDQEGIGNFDIALKETDESEADQSKPFALTIQKYAFSNLKFVYYDERSKMKLVVDRIEHTGKGDFAASKLDLTTVTTAQISIDKDKTNVMKNVSLQLDALLGIDLENNRYVFKENKAMVNLLPLEFEGFIELVADGQQYDIAFFTPTSTFKNFLGLLPSAYQGGLDDIKTTGDFEVKGFAKGLYSESTIPKFELVLASNNASFKYPDLPKTVQNIKIDATIKNETGSLGDTYVNLDHLSFSIDQDVFAAKATLKNIIENPLVEAHMKGTLNLANISKAYPIQLDKPLTGILKADVTTTFDKQAVENQKYQNIQSAGLVSVSGFNYTDDSGKGMMIQEAIVQFNPNRLNLQKFEAKTGKSDLKISGTIENFYGYLFTDKTLKGNFNVVANQIAVADFMSPSNPVKEGAKTNEGFKIPAFLDCSLTASAATVLYDNLTLKDVSGKVIIKEEKVTFENITTSIFGGQIGLNGRVSTLTKVPTFTMGLAMKQVDISETFSQLDLMKNIAPLAKVVNGKLNATITLVGNLDAVSMTPDLKSLSGQLVSQLFATTINPSNATLLHSLDSHLSFIDLKKINLNDLKTNLSFKDGKVTLAPFDLKYQDIAFTIAGSHGFDQSMDYHLKFEVPTKYLGHEVNQLIAKLSPADAAKIDRIPLTALLRGHFSNPKVTTDIKQATTKLTQDIMAQQKQRLINQGTSALGNLLHQNSKTADSLKTAVPTTEAVKAKTEEKVKTKLREGLNTLLKPRKKDS